MIQKFPKLLSYFLLLLLGGLLLAPVITYATLTLDSTSLTSDTALTLKSASSSITVIGETNQTGAITVASSSETLTLNLGTGTGATTVNIATGATNAKTINIGTGANLLNVITLGAASTTLNIAASSTFSGNLAISSLANSLLQVNSSGVVTALASSTAGKVLTATSTAPYFSWETAVIPAGQVAFFNLSSCPTGWTEFTSARGRYIVALPASGNLASTTGTALTNLEDRAAGQHQHGFRDQQNIQGGYTANALHLVFTDVGRVSNDVSPISTATAWVGATENGTVYVPSASLLVASTNAPYIQLLSCSKD